jgi:GntR family transcriptional regulator / MocR family aminotransferase
MKHSAGALISLFDIDRSSPHSLYKQVYSTLRSSILEGHLEPGSRIPSSRQLANELCVSRNTIVQAYDQLQAEDYLESGVGQGSYIKLQFADSLTPVKKSHSKNRVRVSKRGQAMLDAYTPETPAGTPSPFVPGIPALDSFPYKDWQRAMQRAGRVISSADMNYGSTAGYLPLRKSLAAYLAVSRGVRCTPEQIIMVNGVQPGLDLIARILTDPGDKVWIEDPGHYGARSAFAAAQNKLMPAPVDEQGLVISKEMQNDVNANLVYVTPSHQTPTGAIMSLERRLQLINWADSKGAWIIEDDYDSEFRYRGQPLAALQGLVEDAPVLYMGTFSKTFMPSIRMAYLVVPEALVDTFCHARRTVDTHSPTPLQVAMHMFIEEGQFTTHVRKMRNLYAERQQLFLAAAKKHFSDEIHFKASDSGMHLVGDVGQHNDKLLSQAAQQAGFMVPALSDYFISKADRRGLIFGYTCVPSDEIDNKVKELSKVLNPLLK